MQKQKQRCKIELSKYNPKQKNIITLELNRYLEREGEGKVKKIIARLRCGNEGKKPIGIG